MEIDGSQLLAALALVERELVLFAGTFFIIGALDDLGVDFAWAWLRLTGRARTARVETAIARDAALSGPVAVIIPAWREAAVIGTTVRHMLAAWPHAEMRLYVGTYRNDAATIAAVQRAAGGDPRLRLIVHSAFGPTTKADCLNRLYRAIAQDEAREAARTRMVVMHDAEDMVHPAALALLDRALDSAEFVQLPVLPAIPADGQFIAGHYADEFAEAHAKAMVVRSALGAGLPGAGVGCAIDRMALERVARAAGRHGAPFAADSLTEDYELGLSIAQGGGRTMFLRARDESGRLVATSSYFPAELADAVRQKTRWLHGIAFQGWDRLGWARSARELWMRLRDRRGPFTALVLAAAYALLIVSGILMLAGFAGADRPYRLDPVAETIVAVNLVFFAWRALNRFAFTAREYGLAQGLLALARIPIANIIAIIAARRAMAAYWRTLRGGPAIWDKTEHFDHPAISWAGEAYK